MKYCIPQKLIQYSHNTVIMAVDSSDPRLFCTLHLYTVPLSPLLRFVRVSVSDVDSTLLLPCLVQVILDGGLPVASQNRVASFPSITDWDAGVVMITGGSASCKT